MTSLEELEARLSILEQSVASLLATDVTPNDNGRESALWALEGLSQRAPEGGAVLYAGTVDLPVGGLSQWQYTLPSTAVLERDWAAYAAVLAALGNPVRLQILRKVLHGTNTAAALLESLETGTSGQVYHHLKELIASGWLASERRAVYEVPVARIVPLLVILVAAGTPA